MFKFPIFFITILLMVLSPIKSSLSFWHKSDRYPEMDKGYIDLGDNWFGPSDCINPEHQLSCEMLQNFPIILIKKFDDDLQKRRNAQELPGARVDYNLVYYKMKINCQLRGYTIQEIQYFLDKSSQGIVQSRFGYNSPYYTDFNWNNTLEAWPSQFDKPLSILCN
jgi:hypothetical protein